MTNVKTAEYIPKPFIYITNPAQLVLFTEVQEVSSQGWSLLGIKSTPHGLLKSTVRLYFVSINLYSHRYFRHADLRNNTTALKADHLTMLGLHNTGVHPPAQAQPAVIQPQQNTQQAQPPKLILVEDKIEEAGWEG